MNELIQKCIIEHRSTACPKGARVFYREGNLTYAAPGILGFSMSELINSVELKDKKYALQDKRIHGDIIAVFTVNTGKECVGIFSDHAFYYFYDKKLKEQVIYSDLLSAEPSYVYSFDINLELKTGSKRRISLSAISGVRRIGFCKMLMELSNICSTSTESVATTIEPVPEAITYQGSVPKDYSSMNIRIQKNNYNSGALTFQIFDPEEGEFDDANALADENLLVRFTDEKRTITEYADELIQTIFITYYRMRKINVQFYGDYSEYNALIDALNRVKQQSWYTVKYASCSCEINPHCDMDPKVIKENINRLIAEINASVNDNFFIDAMRALDEKLNRYFCASHISAIEENPDAKSLLESSDNVLNDIKVEMNEINSVLSMIQSDKQENASLSIECNEQIKKVIQEEYYKLDAGIAEYSGRNAFEEMKSVLLSFPSTKRSINKTDLSKELETSVQLAVNKAYEEIATEYLALYQSQWELHSEKISNELSKLMNSKLAPVLPFDEEEWGKKIKNEIHDKISDEVELFFNKTTRVSGHYYCGVSNNRNKQIADVNLNSFFSDEFLTKSRSKRIVSAFCDCFKSLESDLNESFRNAIDNSIKITPNAIEEECYEKLEVIDNAETCLKEFYETLQKCHSEINKIINGAKNGSIKLQKAATPNNDIKEGGQEK